jgi:hypothetical protein
MKHVALTTSSAALPFLKHKLLDKPIYKRVNSRSLEPNSWASNSTPQLNLTDPSASEAFVVGVVFSFL